MSKKTTSADLERMRKELDCMHIVDWDQYRMMEEAKFKLIALIAITANRSKLHLVHSMLVEIEELINTAMDWSE